MISWIASTIFGVHYPLRNIRICQTVLRRRLRLLYPSLQTTRILSLLSTTNQKATNGYYRHPTGRAIFC
nr:MAG TPA: hypothetical protein [Caudoviricetes sp.]